ncbi:hypothetical protein F511_34190 [Dorcoceras hygrometricum]|uniref:Dystroglycan-like n=1 Tax=Dorcoceras hygrometricum TaxID=472368 RepID=A0A2Z7CA67_9LAMI|nr:hypothetical protein F511_34190 [Dorcoceras hygrometricum]
MASAYYSNTQHIDFESILAMDVPRFGVHVSSENASVRDGVIISTVAGQLVEISEEWFAESFDLPVDGLADLSEIPKDVIFDARSIVSMSGEPVSLSGKKSQLKIEYRLLCDIMAKSISVKAGSFNAITVEKFSMLTAVVCGVRMNWASILFNILKRMVTPGSKQAKGFAVQISLLLENIPNLELGESSEFPASKILTEKTVHRYVSLNDKVVDEKTWYLASLPKISVDDKGKEPLQLIDPIKGKPPQEHYFLICVDIDLLVKLREKSQREWHFKENIPNLELGESSEFPASKILTEKTVHRYVSLNDKVGAEKLLGHPSQRLPQRNDQLMFLEMNQWILTEKTVHRYVSLNDKVDVVDVRRVVRENHQELNAKVTSLEEQVAATRHDLLDFSAQAQQTLNVITDQLSELVAYINRGGNDKKVEVSSSRPPPDNQNRGSGNTGGGGDIVRPTDIPQRDTDNAQRDILERLMAADRQRER